jgi:hypothetical protein
LRHDQSSRELPIRAPRTNEALPVRHGISDFLEASTAIYPVPPMALSGAARPPPTRRGLSSGQSHMKPWGNGNSPVLRELGRHRPRTGRHPASRNRPDDGGMDADPRPMLRFRLS